MGCVVNGPGESKHSNIGISLPGTFEEPKAPVYVDGRLMTTLKGDRIVAEFLEILNTYVDTHYATRYAEARQPTERVRDVELEIKPPGGVPPSSPRSGC